MKKQLLLLVMILLPMVASAHDIEVQNADGVTIYYNYINDGTELEVTFKGTSHYSGKYSGNLVIPESVTYNGNAYSVTSIGSEAFYQCIFLTSVTIPASVTSIGSEAFYQCYALTSVTIPASVTSIGDDAFNLCIGLTSVIIPNSVMSIGHGVFHGCSDLTSMSVESENSVYDSRNGCNAIIETATNTLIAGCKNSFIPNSVTSIGDYAFQDCYDLTSITIPSSVTSIDEGAFSGCSGLTSITIPNSMTSISNGTFRGCSGLTSVTIPNSVTSIGDKAFYYCSGLTSVTIGNSVTSIGDNAFEFCSGLTSVTIPNSVTSIGNNVFYRCSGLTSVTISNSVKYIKRAVFADCSGLTSVTIPNSVISIGQSAFARCSSLTSVIIPNSVKSIDIYAFQDCSGLTSITIPSSVMSIGHGVFSMCSGLTSMSVESENSAYDSRNGCNAIINTATNTLIAGCMNTIIPNSVTSIYYDAFFGCIGLTSITIPSSVTKIEFWAFRDCSGLASVKVLATIPPTADSESFNKYEIPLYVPAESVDAYKAAEPWKNFKEIVGLSGTTPVEPEKCATPAIQIIDGKLKLSCETEGVTFVTSYTSDGLSDSTLDDEIVLAGTTTCHVSVYATKEGYENSDVATADVELHIGKKGDANSDGEVNIADAVHIVNFIVGKTNNLAPRKDNN